MQDISMSDFAVQRAPLPDYMTNEPLPDYNTDIHALLHHSYIHIVIWHSIWPNELSIHNYYEYSHSCCHPINSIIVMK